MIGGLSFTCEKKKVRTQSFLSGTGGKLKVGPQVPSEAAAAVGPVEEAETESTQEVSWETGKFTQLPAIINLPLISVGSSVLPRRRLERERKGEAERDVLSLRN